MVAKITERIAENIDDYDEGGQYDIFEIADNTASITAQIRKTRKGVQKGDVVYLKNITAIWSKDGLFLKTQKRQAWSIVIVTKDFPSI